MQRGGRSLSGEIRGVFSELLLRRDEVTAGVVTSELTNILGLFVLAAAFQKATLDPTSDDPASQSSIANYIGSQLRLYARPLNTPTFIHDVSGLLGYLANYRLLTNAFYDTVMYLDSPGVSVIQTLQPKSWLSRWASGCEALGVARRTCP